MQTQTHQLLRTSYNSLIYFYSQSNTIFYQEYGLNGFTQPQAVIENVSPYFTTYLSTTDEVYLLAKDQAGLLYFCRKCGDNWNRKVILHAKNPSEIPTKCHISLEQNRITLLYTMKLEGKQEQRLFAVQYKEGKWGTSHRIDTVIPMNGQPFIAYELEAGHILLFYATDRCALHCRELLLYPLTLGTCNNIVQHGFSTKDISVMYDGDKLHMLCLVKTPRNTMQLVYKTKYQSNITPSILLYEDRLTDSCILIRSHTSLWAIWTSGGILCYAKSDDNGITFSSAAKYHEQEPFPLQKLAYISHKNTNHYSTEIYVNKDGNLCVLPNLTDNFFPSEKKELVASEQFNASPSVSKYNNKLELLEASVAEKMEQIGLLSKDLEQRGKEIADLNIKWRTKYKEITDKLQAMEMENKRLKEELEFFHQKEPPLETQEVS